MKQDLPATMPTSGAGAIPLAVDVDGTLVRTDLLHEAANRHSSRASPIIPRPISPPCRCARKRWR